MIVYGAAQETHKPALLSELVRICENESFPMLVGGDFNIIRRQEEKNNANFNPRWPIIFNAIIESLDLREIDLSGRKYTWASRRETPMFENWIVSLPALSGNKNFLWLQFMRWLELDQTTLRSL